MSKNMFFLALILAASGLASSLVGGTCSFSNHAVKWSDRDHASTDGVQGPSLLASLVAKQRRARPSYAQRLKVVRSLGSASLPPATGTGLAVTVE